MMGTEFASKIRPDELAPPGAFDGVKPLIDFLGRVFQEQLFQFVKGLPTVLIKAGWHPQVRHIDH